MRPFFLLALVCAISLLCWWGGVLAWGWPVPAVAGTLDEAGLPAAPRGLDPNGGIKGRRKSKKDKLREATARGG